MSNFDTNQLLMERNLKCNILERIKNKEKSEFVPFVFEVSPLNFFTKTKDVPSTIFSEEEITFADEVFLETRCCNDLDLIKFSDGNYYCLFHLPTFDKDENEFRNAFERRLNWIKNKIASLSNYLQPEKLHFLSVALACDFRYYYFPIEVSFADQFFGSSFNFKGVNFRSSVVLKNCRFNQPVNFSSAEFDQELDVSNCSFRNIVDFSGATFNQALFFENSEFWQKADFSKLLLQPETEFDAVGERIFEKITFNDTVIFTGLLNVEPVQFKNVLFKGLVDFSDVETTATNFYQCKFERDAIFKNTRFSNQVV